MNSCRPIILLFFLVTTAFSWGRVGHETIAYIAEKNLSPATMEKLKPLLAGESLESISTWADEIRTSRRSTGPWHYIDFPVREDVTLENLNQFERGGHNILSQINRAISELKAPRSNFRDKQEALKFLVHFIGDASMPLHCSDDNDRGGNEKRVRFFAPTSRSNRGHETNLHSLWDNLIEVKATEDPAMFGDQLNQEITPTEKREWAKGTPESWALDSYRIAKNVIYKNLPSGAGFVKLPRNYYIKMRPIVDKQLEKAGIRLANVLEEIFKQK